MTADRIKEIQDKTAFPDSISVCQALFQVWNECEQDNKDKKYTYEDMKKAFFNGNVMRDIDEFNCFLTTI